MAWNEPGKNDGQRDPWGKNNRPNGNGGPNGLDQLLKRLRQRFGKLGGGPGGIFTIVLAVLLAWLLVSSATVINTSQTGVVLRFGKYSRTLTPGFHFKLPAPIETVAKVETTRIRAQVGQVRMLTSDENIISVAYNVQYQVSDPRQYLFSTNDPDDTLAQAAEAAVRSVVGSHSMDEILTSPGDDPDSLPASAASASAATAAKLAAAKPDKDDRVTLQQQTLDALQHTLDSYHAGLQVTDVSFQNVAPPDEVKAAFDDVNAAREDKQSAVNKAHAYANQVIPQATGEAARIIAQAKGDKAERIARATGDAERFNLLLKEYKAAPAVTRQRLWLETMEDVMARNPKVIDGSGGRNIINLPASMGSTLSPAATVSADAASQEKQP